MTLRSMLRQQCVIIQSIDAPANEMGETTGDGGAAVTVPCHSRDSSADERVVATGVLGTVQKTIYLLPETEITRHDRVRTPDGEFEVLSVSHVQDHHIRAVAGGAL